jgi:hypothetical protein
MASRGKPKIHSLTTFPLVCSSVNGGIYYIE